MAPPHRGSRTLGRRRATSLVVGLVALIAPLLAATSPASAYWSATGSGSATATTGTLAGPVDVTVPETSIPDVPVSWTAGVTDEPVDGYYVTRYQFSVNTEPIFVPACSSSPTQLITLTSCTDTGLPDGNYTYRVTAVFRSWTATSQSSPVDVVGPALLAFTSDVADTEPDAAILPPLTVALQTEAGTPYAWAGVQVSVAFDANPSEGTLAGETAVMTDDEGVATFDALSINLPGNGYSLVAYSLQLAPAFSNSFDVNSPPLIGAARDYSVLGSSVSNNDLATRIAGDVGVTPAGSLSGLSSDMVGGTIHENDADAAAAYQAVSDTFDLLSGPAYPASGLAQTDLAGVTLDPGVYGTDGGLDLFGTLTLDGQVDPNALFIIKAGGDLTTGSNSSVTLINGARAANVYWVIDGGANLGQTSSLTGNLLASGSIALDSGAELIGRALSLADVNLFTSTIRFARVLPTIEIDGSRAFTADTTPTISGTSTAIAYSRVTVTVAGQSLLTTVRADGTWRVTATELGAGDYQVVAKVRETNGNTASASQDLTVEVNPDPVNLGTASTFSLLARQYVTNSGATTVSGDVGGASNPIVNGFPPGIVDGTIHVGDETATLAYSDATDAYIEVGSRSASRQINGDIGGQTFRMGVYRSPDPLTFSGTVTLDAQDDPDARFIFLSDGLDTATGSQVVLANGAQASNVFWVVGSAATGENSLLVGNILSSAAINLGVNTTLTGLAFALTGGVTLDTATLNGVSPAPAARMADVPDPSETPVPSETPAPTGTDTPVPSPTTTDTPTPAPTADEPAATESPTPSPTPSATATATATAEPSPTAIPTPTPTKDPSPSPSASSTEQGGTP